MLWMMIMMKLITLLMKNFNMERKDLYDISWQVDEPTYRADSALSYSTLSRFEREGFNGLATLYDEIKSPSLTFGSAVDALITGGQKEFDERFLVAEFPQISETIESIVKDLFNECHIVHSTLTSISDDKIIEIAANYNYQNNWKPETRAKVIKEKAEDYYNLLFLSEGKELLDNETYQKVLACVETLKSSPATRWYFMDNDIFDDSVKRYYQIKFKEAFDGVDYRCMMDECVVDYKNKIIYPIDLKTSGHAEWDFPKSFIKFNYAIQARLYYRLLKKALSKDDYFKDFKVDNYRFIVINKETLVPLVWKFDWTDMNGEIMFNTKDNRMIRLRDPFDIGKELYNYLNKETTVPDGISLTGDNDLVSKLNLI